MTTGAARIPAHLLDLLERLAASRMSIAEISRRAGREAVRCGLAQPSYERVRQVVHEARGRALQPTTGEILLEVAFRARPVDAVAEHASGVGARRLDP